MNRSLSFFPFKARWRTGTFCGCVLVVLALVGCGSLQKALTSANNSAALPDAGGSDIYKVRAITTSFFRISPLQASGPDEQLKKDTEVMVVTKTRSYSRIKIPNGDTGYVATEDIGPLTDQEIAAANASNIQAQLEAQRQVAARNLGGSGYTIPPEAGSQEKLPEPDARPGGPKVNTKAESSPTPNPIFRQ